MAAHTALAVLILGGVFPLAGADRRRRLIRWWSAALLRILGTRVAIQGTPPRAAAVIAANHVAWLDIFVLLSVVPCRFVAKSEIRAWPVAGWIAARSGTIFLRRARRRDLADINALVHDGLGAGECIGLFPEGTTGEGDVLLKFHSSLFEPAVANAALVYPASIRYFGPDAQPCAGAIYGDRTFLESVGCTIAEPAIEAQLRFAAPLPAGGSHRREIAARARSAVATLLASPAGMVPGRACGPRAATR